MRKLRTEIKRESKFALFESDRDAAKAMLIAWGIPLTILAMIAVVDALIN